MSSFRVKLDRESVKKWRAHYLLYPKLSRAINAMSEMTSKGSRFNRDSDLSLNADTDYLLHPQDRDVLSYHTAEFRATEKYFLTLFQTEFKRVDAFYTSKFAEIKDEVHRLVTAAAEKSGDGKLLHDWVLHGTKAVGQLKHSAVRRGTSRRPSSIASVGSSSPRLNNQSRSGSSALDFKSSLKISESIPTAISNDVQARTSPSSSSSAVPMNPQALVRAPSMLHKGYRQRLQSVSVVIESTQTLSHAFVSIFKEIMRFERFALLNLTGFVRIWKKYEVMSGDASSRENQTGNGNDGSGLRSSEDYFDFASEEHGQGLLADMHATQFGQLAGLTELMQETEQAYARFFCSGNIQVAKADLHAVAKSRNDYANFYMGIKFGTMLLLFLWVLWDVVVDATIRPRPDLHWRQNIFPIYRFVFCILFLSWCWGLNCYVWHVNRINYVYLFRLNPGSAVTYREVFDSCIHWTLFVLATFLMFYKSERGDVPAWIPPSVWPVATFVAVFLKCLLFLKSQTQGHTNGWRLGLFQVIGAPFTEVTFLAGYIGDVLTSLVKVYTDLSYSLCWLLGGWWLHNQDVAPNPQESIDVCLESVVFTDIVAPLLAALPLWWRMMQNFRTYYDTRRRFPALANAGKYATGMSVVIFGIFRITNADEDPGMSPLVAFYLLCMVISTMYNYLWDIFMDWGLGDSAHGYLREKRMFKYRAYYYFAIFLDFVLRFGWTLTLVPTSAGIPLSRSFVDYATPCLATAEIARRAMWGCFRLENEHLQRTQEHKDLSYIPLYFETRAAEQSNMSMRRIVMEVFAVMLVVMTLGIVSIVSSK